MGTVIYNANVYVDRNEFAEALFIEKGKIVKVGDNKEILSLASVDTKKIDAEGKTLIPGFNDSHMHLHDLGSGLKMIKVSGATSIEEIIQSGRAFIEKNMPKKGTVLRGVGWNQDYFKDGKRLLTRHDLDKISTEYPIIFDRVCGHLVSCNTLALEVAGIDEHTKQVDGGHFEIGPDGKPNGIFGENAIYRLKQIIPPISESDMRDNLKTAVDYACTKGITSIQSRDVVDENYRPMMDAFKSLHESHELPVRICMQCSVDEGTAFYDCVENGLRTNVGDEYLKFGPLKIFADGSLGSRTAYMGSDYHDEKGTRGLRVMPQEEMNAIVQRAAKHGFQVITHAIGDAAIEEVLNSYATVIDHGDNVLRHGIVHCQITDRRLLERFRELNVLAFVQPVFLHYDIHIVEDRVGKEMASTSYAFNTMDRLGVHVSYGTDCPVEDLDPFDNLYCAINRQDLKGFPAGGFFPQEKVDVFQAVDNYTIGSAYASFEEGVKGRLKPNYYADITMLSENIFTMPPERIRDTKVLMTMVGGNIVHQRK